MAPPHHQLAAKILQGFAIGLDRDETYFTQYLTRHASAVRAINYPSYEGYTPPAGQLRASAHTDYGTITILKSGGPGLQVTPFTDLATSRPVVQQHCL